MQADLNQIGDYQMKKYNSWGKTEEQRMCLLIDRQVGVKKNSVIVKRNQKKRDQISLMSN